MLSNCSAEVNVDAEFNRGMSVLLIFQVVFGGLGIVFLAAGLICLFLEIRKRRRSNRLIEYGNADIRIWKEMYVFLRAVICPLVRCTPLLQSIPPKVQSVPGQKK